MTDFPLGDDREVTVSRSEGWREQRQVVMPVPNRAHVVLEVGGSRMVLEVRDDPRHPMQAEVTVERVFDEDRLFFHDDASGRQYVSVTLKGLLVKGETVATQDEG